MTYELAIGDRAYSSWSLRGWLLFEAFGLPVTVRVAPLYTSAFQALLAEFPPAITVPVMRTPDGQVVADSLAMALELETRHPEIAFWPEDPAARGCARMLVAEMHSGFVALREACPMNFRNAYVAPPEADLSADLARLETLWALARRNRGEGPWLFGAYSLADVFFAPVAARIAGYGLPVSEAAQAYVETQLTSLPLRRWRAMGTVDGPDQSAYAMPMKTRPWPYPAPSQGRPVETGPSQNQTCPYSGGPVSDFMVYQDRIWGFCNRFCRDKTAADPTAWPAFVAMISQPA